jgi:putative hydrolase of the HAD superfamily
VKARAVCFDLFHTLVDVGNVPASVGRYTADIFGIDPVVWNSACFSAQHEIRLPTEHHEVLRRLAHSIDPEIPEALIETAVAERQRRFDHALTHIPSQDLQALQQLVDDGYRLALVSNASTAEVAAWPRSPLADLFDVAVFSCHCGYAKPESGIYHEATRRLGVRPEDCLFVGDGGSDEHRGAAAVGMLPVMITRYIEGRFREHELAQRRTRVSHVIAGLAELPGLVSGL